ncbi:bifunctional NAD(P)H-hydrate repair enzyme [Aureimonas sp. SA4125]|uniref:NAD(P)H-hydrate dehydratase n=1 Tax=Aureimonas sp. SA4125 TaxID=2826993 RepID=UPI001CC5FBFE|nr:NAD(P)H-hydrate dehydratase [Aureimonas sp. SA4125]BDA84699.1 bifunctional NAD(P)H-hydrate repair enzyme [Aureimonas sp. SA4125]
MSDQYRDSSGSLLLDPAEMGEADRLTFQAGTPGIVLMERAGQAVADALRDAFPDARRVAILAGLGNNGGDGYVAARLLREAGLAVAVFSSVASTTLKGDAAWAAQSFGGPVEPLEAFSADGADIVVDAIFGAGLDRPISEPIAAIIRATNASGVPVVAVDLPSGISGLSGAVLGEAFVAALTVTFFRRKPGHLLQPGRSRCGRLAVADIGIAADVLATIRPKTSANDPALWAEARPNPSACGHKYDRGHAVVFSGGATTSGAARLAAMAALRAGAGLVTVFAPPSALMVNAAHLTAIMLRRCADVAALQGALEDTRLSIFVLGPGFGICETARDYARAIITAGRALVLDADGITAFADNPVALFSVIGESASPVVLTPHQGEFARLFPDIASAVSLSKLEKVRLAAERSGAVVVLKGADTVIAAPDGRAAINATGTPYLATAGSGDVLCGIIAGLLAQKMPAFEAAACGVWMHGRAAELFGPGLIAEDLPGLLPAVLREMPGAS